jgi:hypothetical protein
LALHFFTIILFGSTTLFTRMTGNSLRMQWPLTSQSHGSVSQREQLFFSLRIKLHAHSPDTFGTVRAYLCDGLVAELSGKSPSSFFFSFRQSVNV